jgi:hypothetical protein
MPNWPLLYRIVDIKSRQSSFTLSSYVLTDKTLSTVQSSI